MYTAIPIPHLSNIENNSLEFSFDITQNYCIISLPFLHQITIDYVLPTRPPTQYLSIL